MMTMVAPDGSVGRRHIVEAVPRAGPRREPTLPLVIVASLLVHGTVLVALFWTQAPDAPGPPHEIAVDLVPPPPAAQTEPPPAKPVQKQAAPEPPKPRPAASLPPDKPKGRPAPKQAQKPAEPPKSPAESPSERLKDLLGPMPGLAAAALPGDSANGTEEVDYSRLVMSRIGKAKKEGRYPGVPGFATVEFVLGDHGEVLSLDLRRPSGDHMLDTEAIALVKRAEPYPPPPPGGRRDYVVTLQFRPVP